jgi:hypothetical protein
MWLKWTKRILATLGILIVLIIAFFVSVVYIYEDEVKQYAIEQLNKSLKVTVKAPKIDLTIWDQFPNSSLRFSDVLIPDYLSVDAKDTMFYAKHIYLSFDFWDMMGGNYKVQKVTIEDGVFNLKINSKGEQNFDIFKKDSTENSNNKFSFELKEVIGKNLHINYIDSLTNSHFETHSNEMLFSGNFNEENFLMKIKSDLILNQIKSDDVSYVKEKNASIDVALNINNKIGLYTIEKGAINLEELLFNVNGTYAMRDSNDRVDLKIKGKNIDLASAFSILPKKYAKDIKNYKAKGLVVFEADVNGFINDAQSPHITAEFYLKDGSMTEMVSGVTLKDLSLDGVYDSDNKGVSTLNIKDIEGSIDVGKIKGELLVEDFSAPKITIKTNGEINLNQLKKFAKINTIEKLSGLTTFNLSFIGKQTPEEFKILSSNGLFHFNDVTLKLPTSNINYTKIYGDIVLKQNDAAISNFHGFAEDSDFRLDGAMKNLLQYILKPEQILTIEADLRSNKLNLDHLLVSDNQNTTSTISSDNSTTPFSLPNDIHLNLKSQIEELNYGKFNATKVTGIVTLYNQNLSAKNFSFKANDGSYVCSTNMLQNPDYSFSWNTNVTAKEVDIENFFYEMDNFGQTFITEKNIKGTANISLNMAALMNNDLTIQSESILAEIQLQILKGELNDQTSMIEIADYLNSMKIIKLVIDTEQLQKKMANIKFSELSNTITIKNSQIMIPKMTISSNVMDINLSGIHGFNDEIDYHFDFTLRKLYYKKPQDDFFGPVADDELGKRLFLRMYGNLEDPQYALDNEEKHEIMKQNIEQEKKDVKSILKSELGLFKKDSTVHNYVAPKKTEPTFEIKWEEFDEKEKNQKTEQNKKEEKEKTTKDKDKGMNKLFKKLGIEEEEKKKKVEIEIE